MRTLSTALLLLALTSPSILAGEGRTPLWEPTTITASGKYIVTRDIGAAPTPAAPRAITIQASDVDIDLNGFTLRLGEPVILAENVSNVAIHGGKITAYEGAIELNSVNRFVVRRVQIASGETPAIIVTGDNGLLENNQLQFAGSGILLNGSAIDVVRNEIRGGNWAITMDECVSCSARENTLTGGSQIYLQAGASGCLVLDNVLSGAGAGQFSSGILVNGNTNHIEGNLVTDFPGFGLFLTGTSSDNVYRKNTIRGNHGTGGTSPPDFNDNGTGNSSGGDNFMPGLM